MPQLGARVPCGVCALGHLEPGAQHSLPLSSQWRLRAHNPGAFSRGLPPPRLSLVPGAPRPGPFHRQASGSSLLLGSSPGGGRPPPHLPALPWRPQPSRHLWRRCHPRGAPAGSASAHACCSPCLHLYTETDSGALVLPDATSERRPPHVARTQSRRMGSWAPGISCGAATGLWPPAYLLGCVGGCGCVVSREMSCEQTSCFQVVFESSKLSCVLGSSGQPVITLKVVAMGWLSPKGRVLGPEQEGKQRQAPVRACRAGWYRWDSGGTVVLTAGVWPPPCSVSVPGVVTVTLPGERS